MQNVFNYIMNVDNNAAQCFVIVNSYAEIFENHQINGEIMDKT